MPSKPRPPEAPIDVREACIAAAHGVIAEQGIEKPSLRDVARRLGGSHQAPYRHCASRDHLLARAGAASGCEPQGLPPPCPR